MRPARRRTRLHRLSGDLFGLFGLLRADRAERSSRGVVRYKISSNTASSLVRAVSEVYAMSGEPNGAPLFPLTRLIDKARLAASCASGA